MSIYEGKIKVVGADRMCFPVDPKTLEALATECFDPYPNLQGQGAKEIISYSEWLRRRNALYTSFTWGRLSKCR